MNKKPWRPERWDEIKPTVQDGSPYDDWANGYDAGVEAGADAMLKALKENKLPDDIAQAIEQMWLGKVPTDWNRPNGTVVFIPDE